MYRDQVMGCWLGKAVGGTLGMPYEGMSGPFDLAFYDPVPREMLPNDDLDLQVVWACLLDRETDPRVCRHVLSRGWLEHIGFPWDEYAVCIRNLREGIAAPQSGSFDNWFMNGMGAAIRSELWACLAPGNPALAAAYAYEDACVDHDRDGLWAEVFLAAMQSAAFEMNRIRDVVEAGLKQIPADSILARAVRDTFQWWEGSGDWRQVRRQILDRYGHEDFTNVTENIAFILLALLDGDGDFSRSICTAANCGKDTDCTAATVGALLGILNPDGIDPKWLEPIGRDLKLSPQIQGISPPPTLDGFTDLVVSLRDRLQGRTPPEAEPVSVPAQTIQVGIGFQEVPWFGQGWSRNKPMTLKMPPLSPKRFPGTLGRIHSDAFQAGMMFLQLEWELRRETRARICFNTRENCRVFVDGAYAFGREGGRMAPSAHRIPINQYVDRVMSPGRHVLTAVIARPEEAGVVEWVAGIADLDDGGQWIPGVFTVEGE